MASWITHLLIAEQILDEYPQFCKEAFCIGSVAPDCNVENEDWSSFSPSREVTHFMQGKRKSLSDCQWFLEHFLSFHPISSPEEASFWWGYYAHLVTDAAFQHLICDDPLRTETMWKRIMNHPLLKDAAKHLSPSWANAKQLISAQERAKDIDCFEADILALHPDSPYLTLLPEIKAFPDYVPFLPSGAITRKLKIMHRIPEPEKDRPFAFVGISYDEYFSYIDRSTALCLAGIKDHLYLTPVFRV